MGKEQESPQKQLTVLTGIHLDLPSRTVTFAAQEHVVATLRLAPEGVIFDATYGTSTTPSLPQPDAAATVATPETTSPEKEKPHTLQGRLKSKPKPGRPDRNKQPTAWARFAAHIEGEDGAHLYSTTFHRHTADIALSLEKDASLTVQGYPHSADDPAGKRLDTLSVINLLDYPGKPGTT